MKASELIKILSTLIEEHGDKNIDVYSSISQYNPAKTVELVKSDFEDVVVGFQVKP